MTALHAMGDGAIRWNVFVAIMRSMADASGSVDAASTIGAGRLSAGRRGRRVRFACDELNVGCWCSLRTLLAAGIVTIRGTDHPSGMEHGMASLTVENYLKTVWQVQSRERVEWTTTGRLASAMGLTPGTVTSMLKALAESGLAEYRPYEGIRLTDSGRTLALRMLRRHRLLELFLAQTLSLSWDQVHDEAEHMEHAVSDFLVDRIDDFLGRPAVDPHGDPIPAADGEMRCEAFQGLPLAEAPAGAKVRVIRVINQEGRFLRFLTESGLGLGAKLVVAEVNVAAGVVRVEGSGGSVSLGFPAALQIQVDVESAAPTVTTG